MMATYRQRGRQSRDRDWDAGRVQQLRRFLQLNQRELAGELNSRQQTVSEWETGKYRPRGPSARLLSLIAEEAGFYEAIAAGGSGEGTATSASGAARRRRPPLPER